MGSPLVDVLAVVGALGAFVNLFLLLSPARRVRESSGRHERHGQGSHGVPDSGKVIGAFRATDTVGAEIALGDLATGRFLVAFLSPGCGSCKDAVDALAGFTSAERPVVIFVSGRMDDPEHAAFVETLPAHARVAIIPSGHDALLDAFGVSSFPTVIWTDHGKIEFAAHQIAPAKQPVAA